MAGVGPRRNDSSVGEFASTHALVTRRVSAIVTRRVSEEGVQNLAHASGYDGELLAAGETR